MTQAEPKVINSELLKTMPWPSAEAKGARSPQGALLIAVGSKHRPGGAILAARAALRLGISVHLAAPEGLALQIGIALPEIIPIPLPEATSGTLERDGLALLKDQSDGCAAAFISIGLARDEATIRQLREAVEELALPLVADHALLEATKRKTKAAANGASDSVLILTADASDGEEVALSVEELLKQAADRNATLVLMRDAEGVAHVVAPDGTHYKDTNEACGLNVQSGENVLAGLIAGLRAQGTEATAAAVWGLHIFTHTLEGARKDLGDVSILASDLPPRLPSVIRYLHRMVAQKDNQPFGLRRNV